MSFAMMILERSLNLASWFTFRNIKLVLCRARAKIQADLPVNFTFCADISISALCCLAEA